jgi:hypothetical protein
VMCRALCGDQFAVFAKFALVPANAAGAATSQVLILLRKSWLGRQDSNLGMAESKSAAGSAAL